MREQYTISIEKFRAAFETAKWIESKSSSGRYIIWTDPEDDSVWTRLPANEDALDYQFYQEKNLHVLLYALDKEDNEENLRDLLSQLKNYNYKLINRIIPKNKKLNSSVPYELATALPQKNVDAFRYFFRTHSENNQGLPIEKFELNHTEVGSFVIPVSVDVKEDDNSTLMPLTSSTNIMIRSYLDTVEKITQLPTDNPDNFADSAFTNSIDSKLVRDFMVGDKGIAKLKEKYSDEVSHVYIGSRGSIILDYGLEEGEQTFKEVDLTNLKAVGEEFVRTLEEKEIENDDTRIEEKDAKVDVIVESIDRTGRVKLTVLGLNSIPFKRPFKAYSTELPKAKLDIFAELFKNSGETTIRGDISKQKGRTAKVVVDNLGDNSSSKPSLFQDQEF